MWNKNLLKETNWAWSWVVILSAKELTQIQLQFPPRQERQVKRVLSDRGDLLRLHLMLLLFSSAPWRQEQQPGELSGYHLMLSHHFLIFSWERTASQMECHTGLISFLCCPWTHSGLYAETKCKKIYKKCFYIR